MENLLYTNLADLYAVIADDRDFNSECADILDTYQEISDKPFGQIKVLELFAGPAYHTAQFCGNYGIDAYAIDFSTQMKAIACNKYKLSENQYIVGELPKILDSSFLDKRF